MRTSILLFASFAAMLTSLPLLADGRHNDKRVYSSQGLYSSQGRHSSWSDRHRDYRRFEAQHHHRETQHRHRNDAVSRHYSAPRYYSTPRYYREYRHSYSQHPYYWPPYNSGTGFSLNFWNFQPLSPHSFGGVTFHYHQDNRRCYSSH